MTDNLTPEDRLKTMKAVKGKGTKPERRLWAMLAGMRLRGWRKNAVDITGKPDVVFDDEQVAIFVDGCFWHKCPHCKRKLPQTNPNYWKRKIDKNVELANQHNETLMGMGWTVIRIWEHEIRKPEHRTQIRESVIQALTRNNDNDQL